MIDRHHLSDELIQLERLLPQDVTIEYVNWLNDSRINRYLECRRQQHTLESTRSYVKSIASVNTELLFGIFELQTNQHVGNIKLGNIDYTNKRCEIGVMIGDTRYRRRGFASRAVNLISEYANKSLNLELIIAGCYEANLSSRKMFKKLGWREVGIFKDFWLDTDGVRKNQVMLELLL